MHPSQLRRLRAATHGTAHPQLGWLLVRVLFYESARLPTCKTSSALATPLPPGIFSSARLTAILDQPGPLRRCSHRARERRKTARTGQRCCRTSYLMIAPTSMPVPASHYTPGNRMVRARGRGGGGGAATYQITRARWRVTHRD